MRIREQIKNDLRSDQLKYLEREESTYLQRVDINELNRRLNIAKRSSFYKTILIAALCLSCLVGLSYIGFKF
jgi:hypothetical protein